jgi:hypothetical protein
MDYVSQTVSANATDWKLKELIVAKKQLSQSTLTKAFL